MSSCDRRAIITGLAALALTSACDFQPALEAGGGAASGLYGQVEVQEPNNVTNFVLTRQLEDRLGRGTEGSPFMLNYSVSVSSSRLGEDRSGRDQRRQLEGEARYRLVRRDDLEVLARGQVVQFTGYSTTGNTVSTRAAEVDARERLSVMLADSIVSRLLLASPDLSL